MKKLTFSIPILLLGLIKSDSISVNRKISSENQWRLVYSENFDSVEIPTQEWSLNNDQDSDPHSDNGSFFRSRISGFTPPRSFRSRRVFGENQWLSIESYSRDNASPELASISSGPDNNGNKTLHIRSIHHTDGTVVRSKDPLPAEYRVCARVGHANFGTGSVADRHNGYEGNEFAEPWHQGQPALNENGFYWMSILDTEPKPRNNVFIHHHRKIVIDSDNNDYDPNPWSSTWNGSEYIPNGKHIIMMFALDRTHEDRSGIQYEYTGQPFIMWSQNRWNHHVRDQFARAVDTYKEKRWYRVCLSKRAGQYGFLMEGDFGLSGQQTIETTIDKSEVFHADGFPEYFMIGDPHVNYYRGDVYVDDISLEVPE